MIALAEGFPLDGTNEEKESWLRLFAERIVNLIWCEVSREDLETIVHGAIGADEDDDNGDGYTFCSCRKGTFQYKGQLNCNGILMLGGNFEPLYIYNNLDVFTFITI